MKIGLFWRLIIILFVAFIFLIGYRLSKIKRAKELLDLPPKVRVAIVEDEESVRISCTEPIELMYRGGILKIEEEDLEFVIDKSTPAKLKYMVIVDTLPVLDKGKVTKVMKKWRDRGYDVKKKLVGRIIRNKSDYTFDNRFYFISIMKFNQKEEAQTLCDKLYKEGAKGWVLEELVRRARGKIKIKKSDGALLGSYKPPLKISSRGMIKIHDVPYGVGFSWEGREDRLYRGKIEVNLNKKGRICVINEIELEEYLLGIVPSEVSSQAPIEILKAQCIAARGEAVAKIGKRHLADPYDFCSLQHCQVYSGIKLESPSTNKAVKETVGKILVDKFGIIDTVYSANCGGHTECNENVWASRKNPALRGVPDFNPEEFKSPITEREIEQWLTSPPEAYCSKAKNFRWEVTYTQDELNQLVNKWREVGEVRDIILRDRGVSGRLKSIKIIGTDDTYTIYKELPIRKVLGNLPSAMFILRIDRDEEGFPIQFRFIGGGWGHGVGMCQAGAVGMAKIGKTYNEILTHYYSGSKIIKLY